MYNSTISLKPSLRLLSFDRTQSLIKRRRNLTPLIQRFAHTKSHNDKELLKPTDLEIPVPWGKISAQHWGDPSKKPVLCMHGWKDNAATFDRLFPLMVPQLPNYQFLSIDLPGHGFSSHFPPGMIYQMADCLVLINRILRHFNWSKISILGHSYGAQIGFMYSGTQPDVVENFMAIDALTPFVMEKDDMIAMVPKLINDTLNFETKLAKKSPPLYSYEEILKRVMKGNMSGLDESACKILMSRGIIETPPGSGLFRFSHDIRVQYLPVTTFSSRQVSYLAKNFKTNVLHLRAKDGVRYEKPYVVSKIEKWLNISNETYPQNPHVIKFVVVDGLHHVHLSNPENVLSHIVDFLNK